MIGSTCDARRAGNHDAAATPAESTMMAPTQIHGPLAGISGH